MELEMLQRFCSLLDDELARRNNDLSVLGAGGSFEQWLAFRGSAPTRAQPR
ncbi:MAG: hypothetical protein H6719_29820 [Sandaracinaceae bacterium]|nr:hypothetical protein [Sandaracinaceae bacterium]